VLDNRQRSLSTIHHTAAGIPEEVWSSLNAEEVVLMNDVQQYHEDCEQLKRDFGCEEDMETFDED